MRRIYGKIYRATNRLMHRYNIHRTHVSYMEDTRRMEWCHWCGLRQITGQARPITITGPDMERPKSPTPPRQHEASPTHNHEK